MSKENKGKLVIIMVLLVLLLMMITVVFLVFRPIDGEEEMFEEEYGSSALFKNWAGSIFSKEEFKKMKAADAKELQEYNDSVTNAATGTFERPENIDLHTTVVGNYAELNEAVLAIATEAMNHPAVDKIDPEYKDPLIILAQMMTETNNVTNTAIMWVPALPTAFMTKDMLTVEVLQKFNTADAAKLKGYPAEVKTNTFHQGPLQLTYGYGPTNSGKWDDTNINYKSDAASIQADPVALQMYNSGQLWSGNNLRDHNHKNLVNIRGKLGDRHNFNDAAISGIQSWDYFWGRMSESQRANIDSMAAAVAAIAMNHNIGQSVMDNKNMGRTAHGKVCKKSSSCTYGDIWEYVKWFNTPGVQEDIRAVAVRSVTDYKNSKSLTHISDQDMVRIFNKHKTSGVSRIQVGVKVEGANHPFRMVYWYYVAQELYYNGSAYK